MGVFVSLWRVLDGEHRQVIALFLLIHELVHLTAHHVDHFLGSSLCGLCKNLFDSADAELLVGNVFGLGQSIGVEEDRGVFIQNCLLRLEFEVFEQANGNIRYHGQGSDLLVAIRLENVRYVVAGIAVAEPSGRQVKHTDEEGDEDVFLVAFA